MYNDFIVLLVILYSLYSGIKYFILLFLTMKKYKEEDSPWWKLKRYGGWI